MSMSDEDRLVELVSWIEKAGHGGDALKNLKDFISGNKKSCRRTEIDGSKIEDGVVFYRFWFPLPELQKVCPINDLQQLEAWMEAISVDYLDAKVVKDPKMGTCVKLTRAHYVPKSARPQFDKLDDSGNCEESAQGSTAAEEAAEQAGDPTPTEPPATDAT